MRRFPNTLFAVGLAFLLAMPSLAMAAGAWSFRVSFTESVHPEPYTGRVYLFLSTNRAEPRTGPSWFNPETFLARDVRDWKPGEPLEFSPTTEGLLAYPDIPAAEKLRGLRVQAVARFNPYEREIGAGPGNGFSPAILLDHPDSTPLEQSLTIGKLVPEPKFVDSEFCRELVVPSKLLGTFHGREVVQRAAVLVPKSYFNQPERRYPVMFQIPGFSGTHFGFQGRGAVDEQNEKGVEFIRVLLDPACPLGHHVFADSANNGPMGEAFITEFIPALDRQYRTIADPRARFLTGHSSGGWSSLWVQVTYPEHFNGTWSTAPDPVDFRDFQRINLYRAGENMYVDPQGVRRPLARAGGEVRLWYRGFAEMEHVLGYGGQLHSFEAVFSPRGEDGAPRLVWNRKTGEVDTDVARTWEKYDIRLILERNWPTLGPKLAGKLHVHMGDQDTFYLEGATVLLKESLEKLGSDAMVEIHGGKDHGNLLQGGLTERIRKEMVQRFLKSWPEGLPAE